MSHHRALFLIVADTHSDNKEFCILPLTTDVQTNPFRVSLDQLEGADYLLHAVLATSSHFLSKRNNDQSLIASMYDHQSIAMRSLGQALSHSKSTKLFDTLMLLVNFGVSQIKSCVIPSSSSGPSLGNSICIWNLGSAPEGSSEAP